MPPQDAIITKARSTICGENIRTQDIEEKIPQNKPSIFHSHLQIWMKG